ncbi:DUF1810 domain-containing protein [Pseudarthrobacter sp. C1]|uniref:DUF1810 domain-containing protein n=1 Tax=Pseudarthrobacter sp. C1 TaxID=3108940 RepID=UPI002B052659|nr:DUF1810 domain-containing protein [Pseudarthrobacter sp. C1]MEA3550625.1 DUF1810 domain-containing protein [Pseudarthrobacter sp. C1]HET7783954.1 DUF1810 domain-containing protein [Arthrobacter sp.]
MNDPYDLKRFVSAQDSGAGEGGTFGQALAELQLGNKAGHWMWFIFPQLAGLGQSPTSRKYAITSLAEARAYLDHEVLGPRLLECALAFTNHAGRTAEEILGGIDARKLHSSMTLFLRAAPGETVFKTVLAQFFDGQPDEATDALLAEQDQD